MISLRVSFARKTESPTKEPYSLLTDVVSKPPCQAAYNRINACDTLTVGGASNTGGAVLRHFFDDEQIAALTPRLRPDNPAGLDYYPLLRPGASMKSISHRWPYRHCSVSSTSLSGSRLSEAHGGHQRFNRE